MLTPFSFSPSSPSSCSPFLSSSSSYSPWPCSSHTLSPSNQIVVTFLRLGVCVTRSLTIFPLFPSSLFALPVHSPRSLTLSPFPSSSFLLSTSFYFVFILFLFHFYIVLFLLPPPSLSFPLSLPYLSAFIVLTPTQLWPAI
ncbi:hypothetical protein B0H13DRAFT_2013798 [Mycena leptocephala]|nr:hypothetical protein B0H13DRAFT_2013798 [Mycena leptocephala]